MPIGRTPVAYSPTEEEGLLAAGQNSSQIRRSYSPSRLGTIVGRRNYPDYDLGAGSYTPENTPADWGERRGYDFDVGAVLALGEESSCDPSEASRTPSPTKATSSLDSLYDVDFPSLSYAMSEKASSPGKPTSSGHTPKKPKSSHKSTSSTSPGRTQSRIPRSQSSSVGGSKDTYNPAQSAKVQRSKSDKKANPASRSKKPANKLTTDDGTSLSTSTRSGGTNVSAHFPPVVTLTQASDDTSVRNTDLSDDDTHGYDAIVDPALSGTISPSKLHSSDLYEVPRHYDHNFAGRGGLFDSGISPDVVARSVPDVEEKTPLASTHSLKSRSTPSISSIGLQVDSAHKTAAGGGDSSMPVLPSLSRQTTELNSPQLGRRGLPNSISDTRLGLANMSDVLAGSSEYSSRAVSPRSASLISSSGAAIVKAERDVLERQMNRARNQIAELQAERKVLADKLKKIPGTVEGLESQLRAANNALDKSKQEHVLALAQKERQVNADKEWEVEEAQRQKREVERERDTLCAEIEALEASLEVTRKEVAAARHEVTSEEKRKRRTFEGEVTALKTELQVVKGLLRDNEEARKRDQHTLENKTAELNRCLRETAELSRQVEEKANPHFLNGTDQDMDVNKLQQDLKVSQKMIANLQDERAIAMADLEEAHIRSALEMQVYHKQEMRKVRAEGDRLQAIIKKHEDSIHKLTVDLNDSKFSQGLKVEEFERSLSPGGTKSKTARQGSAMQYSFGRWTAHRADSRKHAEEMRVIIEALEREGYGPNQATVDEVIRHLWWKKEKATEELTEADSALKSMPGGDPRQAIEKWHQEKEDLVRQVEVARDATSSKIQEMQILEVTTKKEIQQLVLDKQQAVNAADLAKRKFSAAEQEVSEMRQRIATLQGSLVDAERAVVSEKGEIQSSMVKIRKLQVDLDEEQRTSAMLRAEIKTLQTEIVQKDKALASAARDREATVEKLGEAGTTVENNAQQLAVAKTKMQHLEGELSLYRQQITAAQTGRDSLQAQLDESRAHCQSLQISIEREQQQVLTLKSEVAVLEEHFATLRHDLEKERVHGDELRGDTESSRAAIAALERSVQSLEAENNMLRSEVGEKSLELGKSSSAHRSLSHQLATLRDDVSDAQSKSQQLNMELGQVKAQLEVSKATVSRLEMEKSHLEQSLGEARASVQDTGLHVEQLRHEEQVFKNELSARSHELDLAKAESKRLAEQISASKEHLRAEQHTLEEKQNQLQKTEHTLLEEQEKSRKLEASSQRLSSQLEATIQTLEGEKDRSAEWKGEAEKYQKYYNQLQVDVAKLQQQCDGLSKELDTSLTRSRSDAEQMTAKIRQLQEMKMKLDGDVETALSTIEMGNSEKAALQQRYDKLQAHCEEEKVLRAGEQATHDVHMQQKSRELADYKQRLDAMQTELDSLKAENKTIKSQASRDAISHEEELRDVLSRLESEAMKAEQFHRSQVDVLSGSEVKAQARCQQLCEEIEVIEKQRNAAANNLALSKNSARELFEEKTLLERQVEEVRRELENARSEQMQFVQQSGRQQTEHTEQLRSLANQHQETLKELSAAHQVSQFMAQENNKLQQQIDLLQESLKETRAAADKMRARHTNEMEELNRKLQSSTLSEARVHGDIQQLRKEHEAQLAALRSKASALDGDVARISTNNRLLETECASLKNRLGMATEDLEAALEANTALTKGLHMEKEGRGRMEGSLKEEISRQQQVTYSLSQQLANTENAKSALQENYDDVKSKLEHSTKTLQDMQNHASNQREVIEEIEDEKRQLDMMSARLEGEMSALKDTLEEEKRESQTLRQRVKTLSQEMDKKQDESLDAQKRFNSLLGSLHADFAKEKASLTDERDSFQEHVDKISAELEGTRRLAQQRDGELTRAQDNLAEAAKKIASTVTALESEMSLRGTLQQNVAKLEEEKRVCENRIDSLEQKVKAGIEQRDKLQGQMDSAHKTCKSLRDQLQQNRDTSADNVARLKQQSAEIESRLSEEVRQLNEQLSQSRANLLNTKSGLEAVSAARDKASDEVKDLVDRLEDVQRQLNDENTGKLIAQQEVQHLEYRLKEDKRLQAKSEKKLKQLQKTLADLEVSTDKERREREIAVDEKDTLLTSLHAEQTRCVSLKEQAESLQAQLLAASKRLEDEGKRAEYKTKQVAQDLSSQRIQFQLENQKLQSTVSELTVQLDRLKEKVDKKNQEIAALNTAKLDAEHELKRLERSLSDNAQQLADKRQLEEKQSMRVAELEAGSSLLKSQVDALKRNEDDIKDYKKRLEGNSRAEMHRVLAEVSRHMEQQHVAHRNLDKMRAENEHVLKEESERKKGEMHERLSSAQAELDQLKIKYRTLKSEYDELRQLRKDDQRARRRLESRLDRVNDTLSQTHSSLGSASATASYLPSSPVRELSRTRPSAMADMDTPLLSSTPRKSWK